MRYTIITLTTLIVSPLLTLAAPAPILPSTTTTAVPVDTSPFPSPGANLTNAAFVPSAEATVDKNAADLFAIRKAIYLYPEALDSKNLTKLDTLFTPNAIYSMPLTFGAVTGLSSIKSAISHSTPSAVSTHHEFSGEEITIIDEKAGTAVAKVNLVTSMTLHSVPFTEGYKGHFTDHLVRTRDGAAWPQLEWRFDKRVFTMDAR